MALGLPTTPCNKKSSNSSSTSASTQNYDQRMVVDGGSIGINGDGNRISMTDGGAVRDALDFAGTANALSVALASVATDRALDSSDNALRTIGIGNAQALDFAKSANDRAMQLATTSTETAYKSTADAIGFAGNALGKTIDIGKRGLEISAEQQRINADGLLSGMGKLIDFAKDTASTARQVSENAQSNVAAAYSNVQEISTGQRFLVAGALAIAGVVAVSKMKG
ncbi:hypothetical protein OJJOAM_000243 [Cupriavidus sp. H18C1]